MKRLTEKRPEKEVRIEKVKIALIEVNNQKWESDLSYLY